MVFSDVLKILNGEEEIPSDPAEQKADKPSLIEWNSQTFNARSFKDYFSEVARQFGEAAIMVDKGRVLKKRLRLRA